MKGIYLIRCKKNDKVYIGQSFNIKKRYSLHLSKLRKGRHPNIYLQEDFNLYGESEFFCETIFEMSTDECERQKLYDLEIYYISLFDSTNRQKGYNLESGGKSTGRFSNETKKKMSCAKLGKKHTENTKMLFSKMRKGKPSHWIGKKQTKEHIAKRTMCQNGKVWVNNGVDSKFVTKEESLILQQQGFSLGRPFFTRVKGKKYQYKDNMYTLSEIAKKSGIGRSVLYYRLKRGWDMDKATSMPIKK